MKKLVFVILVLGVSISLISCGKKQAALEESQEPVSIDTLSMLNRQTQVGGETKTVASVQAVAAAPTPAAASAKPETALSAIPTKPTTEQIQAALKNAGFYNGNIDGKSGPLTRKAIEEFQKANNLGVDGKVGSKTWGLLSAYLNPVSVVVTPEKKKR